MHEGVKVVLFASILKYPENINPKFIFSGTSLSRKTLIKENFLVSLVLLTLRFHAVLTEKKGIIGNRKY